jgi:virulence factor Mce-like protein
MSGRLGLSRKQLTGLVVVVLGTLVWVFAFTGGFAGLFAASTTTVKARFASVEDIVGNDPVRIDGVEVGTVNGVSADPGGNGGTVTMSVQSQYHIYNDASASLVWRTILGANDAIAINPGTKDAGRLQGPIPASRDSNQVELDEVLLPFRDGAQTGLQTMLNQLGPALSNHFDLGNDLNQFRGIAHAADVGGGALRGEIQDQDLRNLVKHSAQAANALSVGTDASETRQFVQSAAQTLQDLGANSPNLTHALQAFRAAYTDGYNYIFPEYNTLFYKADSLVKKLHVASPAIVPTLDQLNPTLTNAHELLSDATPLVHKLAPAVDSLANAATVGVPLINQLKPGLTDLQKTTLPGLAAKYPEDGGRTAYEEIGPTFIGLGVLTDFFNSDGAMSNLTAGLMEPQTSEFLPCTEDFSHSLALVCASLSNSLQDFFSGGSSLLKALDRKPGGAAIYGGLLKGAQRVEGQLSGVQDTLKKVLPNAANFLFSKHSGGVK